jgi:hypothetical protein
MRLMAVARSGLVGPLTIGIVAASVAVALATHWDDLPSYEWRFAPGWLALSVLASTGLLVAVSALWCAVLACLAAPVAWRDGQAVFAKSLLARYVPTGALAVVVRLALAERLGVPKRVCFASVVYEVGLSLAGAVLVAAWLVLTWPRLEAEPARYTALAVLPLVIVALHPAVFRPVADRLFARLGRDPLPSTLGAVQVWRFLALYSSTTLLGGARHPPRPRRRVTQTAGPEPAPTTDDAASSFDGFEALEEGLAEGGELRDGVA